MNIQSIFNREGVTISVGIACLTLVGLAEIANWDPGVSNSTLFVLGLASVIRQVKMWMRKKGWLPEMEEVLEVKSDGKLP